MRAKVFTDPIKSLGSLVETEWLDCPVTEKTNQLQPEYGLHLRATWREEKGQAKARCGGMTSEVKNSKDMSVYKHSLRKCQKLRQVLNKML